MTSEAAVRIVTEVGEEFAADLGEEQRRLVAGLVDCMVSALRRRAPADRSLPTERTATPGRTPGPDQIEAATDSVVARMGAIYRACVALYRERSAERGDVWRRSGLRGQTFHVYAKAERAFMQVMRGEVPNPDHFVDLINYAVFALILHSEYELAGEDELGQAPLLNGEWPWA